MNWKKWACALVATFTISAVAPQLAQAADYDDVFIVYKSEAGKQLIEKNATRIVKDFDVLQTVEGAFTKQALQILKQSPEIQSIQKKSLRLSPASTDSHILTNMKNPTWNIERLGIQKLWQNQLTGKGIKVAMIDTGVKNLTMFQNVKKLSFVADDLTTATDESNPEDVENHGTRVASVISTAPEAVQFYSNPNSTSSTKLSYTYSGIAPNVELYSLKVTEPGLGAELSNIASAIEWSIANKIDVLNISLGVSLSASDLQTNGAGATLKNAIAKATKAGITIVSATGNDSKNGILAPVLYPAAFDNVIAVGATDNMNNVSSFSNGGKAIDVVAPGENIPAINLEGAIVRSSGTSFASPEIAGVIALLKEKFPTYTPKQLKEVLLANTVDYGAKGFDNSYGNGFVNFASFDPKKVTVSKDTSKVVTPNTPASSLPTASTSKKVKVQSDAQKYVSSHQVTITKWITALQKGKKLNFMTQFGPLYSVYYELAAPEKKFITNYRKKIKAVSISSAVKSSKLKATNLTQMKKKKYTKLTFTTAIKPSTVKTSNVKVFKAGKAVSGVTLKKDKKGKWVQVKMKNTLTKGHYVIVINNASLKTMKNKKVTTPFVVRFVVK